MCALGMDYDVCATLQKMSGDNRTKHRWIMLGKTMSQSPVAVTTSLPQGDGLSPLAMNAMLSAAIGAIPPHLRRGERQCIFLDGRTVCTKTLNRAKELQELWATVGESLGFKEDPAESFAIVCNKQR